MDPKYQPLLTALQQLGVDPTKLDPATLEAICAACPTAAPPAAPPALNAEGDDKEKKDAPAQYTEKQLQAAMAAAVAGILAPVQTQLEAVKTQLAASNARWAASDQAASRATVAAFCEQNKDKIFPYELDPKVGPTVIDQALQLPGDTVATFAEGKVSPRAAFLKSIENRPPIARFAEKLPQPMDQNDPNARRNELLAMSTLGRSALKAEANGKK